MNDPNKIPMSREQLLEGLLHQSKVEAARAGLDGFLRVLNALHQGRVIRVDTSDGTIHLRPVEEAK